jgi:hypothetical protein
MADEEGLPVQQRRAGPSSLNSFVCRVAKHLLVGLQSGWWQPQALELLKEYRTQLGHASLHGLPVFRDVLESTQSLVRTRALQSDAGIQEHGEVEVGSLRSRLLEEQAERVGHAHLL